MCSSSAVTLACPAGRTPSRRMRSDDEVSSSQTTGAATFARSAIGREATRAIGTAARKAICLGTSSPTTRLAYVVTAITSAKPTWGAYSAGTPRAESRSPTGPPRLAPE